MVVVPFAAAQSQINMKTTGVEGSASVPTKFDISQDLLHRLVIYENSRIRNLVPKFIFV